MASLDWWSALLSGLGMWMSGTGRVRYLSPLLESLAESVKSVQCEVRGGTGAHPALAAAAPLCPVPCAPGWAHPAGHSAMQSAAGHKHRWRGYRTGHRQYAPLHPAALLSCLVTAAPQSLLRPQSLTVAPSILLLSPSPIPLCLTLAAAAGRPG